MGEKPDKGFLYRAFYLPVETCFHPLYNFSRLLKNPITAQCVMLNLVLNLFQHWFSISTESMDYETLNQVQGDK